MRKIFLAGFAACVVLGALTNAPAQDQIEAGEQFYEEHCATCHGVKLRRTGAIPDLKEQKSDGRARFDQMVMAGAARCRRGRASSVANSTSCGPTLGRAHTTGRLRIGVVERRRETELSEQRIKRANRRLADKDRTGD